MKEYGYTFEFSTVIQFLENSSKYVFFMLWLFCGNNFVKEEDMAKGYMGKTMWVNLTSGEIGREEIADEIYQNFLSGYGLAARLLYERIPPGTDALGPDNILAFVSGLLTATGSVFSGRWMACAKSPLTGGWGDANCGGDLSPAIKGAGVDGIFFTGAAARPVYLVVDEERVELKDAGQIWGKDCVDTDRLIRQELGDDRERFKIACIGPAGEKLSLIAGICNDRGRYAARSGLGAVMGAKKLKAIAVRGSARPEVHDPEEVKELTRQFLKNFKRGEFLTKILRNRLFRIAGKLARIGPPSRNPGELWRAVLKKYGTCGITAMSAENGDSPVQNWIGTGFIDFPLGRSSKISDDAAISSQVKKYGCYSCPLQCGGIMTVTDGPYPLAESHKPEYESLCSFGALCLVDDLPALLQANDMCNRGGVDTISCGSLVAFAMECYERSILTKEDTGGLELKWGSGEAMLQLVDMIIRRQGIGDVLADGVKRAAAKIGKGSEQWAIHAGGQELPMHDPRFDPGVGIAYECEPTPGRHTIASYTWQDLIGIDHLLPGAQPIKAMTTRKTRLNPTARIVNQVLNSKLTQVINGAGVCIFGMGCGLTLPLFPWLNAVTGWNKSAEDYLIIGERIQTLRHSFNVREGQTPLDSEMSPRAKGSPPSGHGPHKGVTLDTATAREHYYKAFGWDTETGKPLRDALEKLRLSNVVKDFYG